MIEIHFNRIYIIESLKPNDKLTGTDLYNNLLRYQSIKHPNFEAILKSPKDKKEWNQIFDEIYADCITNRNAPILHFEVHGSVDKDGLVLTSRELVSWEELYADLAKINIAIKNELFITMAVCHGNYLLRTAHINRPAPFRGMIGSFEAIQVGDLAIRYEEFYTELFDSFDINKAYDRLLKANPTLPNSYKCYGAEYVFARVSLDYASTYCTEEALIKRAKLIAERGNHIQDEATIKNRIRERSIRRFHESYERFFIIDKYPELAGTVEFPNDFNVMKAWFQSFHKGIDI